jgi:hypothetical protein
MFNPFEFAEVNLGRAGWLLSLEILGGIALASVLSTLGHAAELALVAVFGLHLITAWLIGKAAAAQGKSQWLYAIPAVLPPIAIALFVKLHGDDAMRLD